jgi:ABC-type sugar transport system ATPase subunit
MGNDYIISMNNISKRFPGVTALDDVSFHIKKGEIHVLMGENGAGKSTLIKILTGIYKQDSGSIFFDGREFNRIVPRKFSVRESAPLIRK